MKRALSLILALILSLNLCACNSSSTPETTIDTGAAAVENVVNMITALNDVSLTSGAAISNAEAAYEALTDEQKASVTNYENLTKARAFYDRILNVFTLIEAIGAVTEKSEEAILAAEKAYGELSVEEKIFITNTATLTAARAAFDAIPTKVLLTVDNVKDYFTINHSSSTSEKDIGGRYGTAISGKVTAKQSVTLAAIENVTITVRVTCSVGRPVDGSFDAKEEYETETYNVVIKISATDGSGSASYKTDGHYVSKYWYPTIDVKSVKITAVTGTVLVDK